MVDAEVSVTTPSLTVSTPSLTLSSWVPTQLGDSEFASWQTNALLLGVIATLFVAFSKHELKGNKRCLAITAASLAVIIEFWALAAYYNSGVTSGYWLLFVGLLVVAALFIYLAVVAAMS